MTELTQNTPKGAVIFDSELFERPSDAIFQVQHWASVTPVIGALRAAGRGNTLIVSDGEHEFVLRKFVRGGLIGKLISDTYFWNGEDKTRCFAEWRLLHKLSTLGFNVPQPAAARYRRTAMFYTAELLTVRVPGIQSLVDRLKSAPLSSDFWPQLGAALYAFHEAGVFHADLNAYNVQVDEADRLWLLDFDRGKILENGPWKQKTLGRLHRSLRKVSSLAPEVRFSDKAWEALLDGYFNASRSE